MLTLKPSNLTRSPIHWTPADVKVWLKYCVANFEVAPVCVSRFDMNGKALCLLTKKDFIERAPHAGDVLYNAFQCLRQQDGTHFPCRPVVLSPTHSISSVPLSGDRLQPSQPQGPRTAFISIQPHPQLSADRSVTGNSSETTSRIICNIAASNDNSDNSNPEPKCKNNIISSNNIINNSNNRGIIYNRRQSCNNNILLECAGDKNQIQGQADALCLANDGQNLISNSIPASMLSPALSDTCILETDASNIGNGLTSECRHLDIEPRMLPLSRDPCLSPASAEMSPDDPEDSSTSRLLWEFIYEKLGDDMFSDLVLWESQEHLTFRIINPMRLAVMWGQQKNKSNMTYEKLSRALRYYYKMNILKKVPGKRLTYQYLQHPSKIRKGQRGARPHASRALLCPNIEESPTSSSNKPLMISERNPSSTQSDHCARAAMLLSLPSQIDVKAETYSDVPTFPRETLYQRQRCSAFSLVSANNNATAVSTQQKHVDVCSFKERKHYREKTLKRSLSDTDLNSLRLKNPNISFSNDDESNMKESDDSCNSDVSNIDCRNIESAPERLSSQMKLFQEDSTSMCNFRYSNSTPSQQNQKNQETSLRPNFDKVPLSSTLNNCVISQKSKLERAVTPVDLFRTNKLSRSVSPCFSSHSDDGGQVVFARKRKREDGFTKTIALNKKPHDPIYDSSSDIKYISSRNRNSQYPSSVASQLTSDHQETVNYWTYPNLQSPDEDIRKGFPQHFQYMPKKGDPWLSDSVSSTIQHSQENYHSPPQIAVPDSTPESVPIPGSVPFHQMTTQLSLAHRSSPFHPFNTKYVHSTNNSGRIPPAHSHQTNTSFSTQNSTISFCPPNFNKNIHDEPEDLSLSTRVRNLDRSNERIHDTKSHIAARNKDGLQYHNIPSATVMEGDRRFHFTNFSVDHSGNKQGSLYRDAENRDNNHNTKKMRFEDYPYAPTNGTGNTPPYSSDRGRSIKFDYCIDNEHVTDKAEHLVHIANSDSRNLEHHLSQTVTDFNVRNISSLAPSSVKSHPIPIFDRNSPHGSSPDSAYFSDKC